MALTGLPPNAASIGSIEIGIYLGSDGQGVAFGHEGLSKEAVIGHLMTVADRLREEVRLGWATCPGCGLPWDQHGDDEEKDEEFEEFDEFEEDDED